MDENPYTSSDLHAVKPTKDLYGVSIDPNSLLSIVTVTAAMMTAAAVAGLFNTFIAAILIRGSWMNPEIDLLSQWQYTSLFVPTFCLTIGCCYSCYGIWKLRAALLAGDIPNAHIQFWWSLLVLSVMIVAGFVLPFITAGLLPKMFG